MDRLISWIFTCYFQEIYFHFIQVQWEQNHETNANAFDLFECTSKSDRSDGYSGWSIDAAPKVLCFLFSTYAIFDSRAA